MSRPASQSKTVGPIAARALWGASQQPLAVVIATSAQARQRAVIVPYDTLVFQVQLESHGMEGLCTALDTGATA